MKIVIGTILFRSDLSLLTRSVRMFFSQSILKQREDVSIEIVILDNDEANQIQDARALFRKELPKELNDRITMISSRNVGFAKGQNRIFAHSREMAWFDYYLCVNPDGIPHPDMLEELCSFAKDNENNGIYEARQFPCEHPKIYDPKTGVTAWCSACCLMFPGNIYEELNGFDEFFFMYMEDVDLSWRTKLLGYNCYTVHKALFSHFTKDRDLDLDNRRKLMLISGYKLGLKYGNKRFAGNCVKEAEKVMAAEEIHALKESVNREKETVRFIKARKFMEFNEKFYFSRSRW